MLSALDLTLVYLIAAVLGVVVCRSLKLPPILGYLVVGVIIGPNALSLASDVPGVQHLAEFGVVFLMFAIGLEFNLPKLHSMRSLVFGLGLLQVVITVGGTILGNSGRVLVQSGTVTFLNNQSYGGVTTIANGAVLNAGVGLAGDVGDVLVDPFDGLVDLPPGTILRCLLNLVHKFVQKPGAGRRGPEGHDHDRDTSCKNYPLHRSLLSDLTQMDPRTTGPSQTGLTLAGRLLSA